MMMRSLGLLLLGSCLLVVGCTKDIPNTTVEDTVENREVIKFLEKYRKAVEARDVSALLRLAHPQYLDDNGTPIGDDDLDFVKLERKLKRWNERVKDIRYEIKYRAVKKSENKYEVDFRYSASFRLLRSDDEERWSRRVGDQRILLVKDKTQGTFLILSGM